MLKINQAQPQVSSQPVVQVYSQPPPSEPKPKRQKAKKKLSLQEEIEAMVPEVKLEPLGDGSNTYLVVPDCLPEGKVEAKVEG